MINNTNTPNRRIVILTVTESCNLNCVYCYEKSKTKREMSIEKAKEIIAFEFENSPTFDEIEIDLFGGEPTLRKRFIKEIVEWTKAREFTKPFIFYIDTNGTLIKGKFKDWLLENKEYVWVGLSLDGTPESHNKNRSNSYYNIDIPFFTQNYPGQSVRMTINVSTINNLSKDIIHLHSLGFSEVTATFANGINWDFKKIKENLISEIKILIDFYLENPSLKPCSIFDMKLPEILYQNKPISKWCGCGTNMVSYTTDGTSYPCHTFQPNTTGCNTLVNIDFDSINDFKDIECESCPIERICSNCYGLNLNERNNILSKDKRMCEIHKVRAFATSMLLSKQIEGGIKDFDPNELYQIIEAIELIQSELTI
jgi:uncharacterized protein